MRHGTGKFYTKKLHVVIEPGVGNLQVIVMKMVTANVATEI